MRASNKFLSSVLVATVTYVLAAQPAEADLWLASGTGSDGALSASAGFSISNGSIEVTLTNTLDASVIRSAGEALSGVIFTLSNGTTTTSLTGDTATGQLVNVTGTNGVTDKSGAPDRWLNVGGGSSAISNQTITLETLGGGKPSEMILPYIVTTGTYSNSNGNFTNFNENVDGPAMFTLNLAGVTRATTITSVKFLFGTGPDTTLTGTEQVQSAPEPSTFVIAVVGALGFLGYGLRRRARSGGTHAKYST